MTVDYRFARRPIWLLGHLLALAAIVLFVVLGSWQLQRHDERSTLDDLVTVRSTLAPLDLDAARALSADELELRQVSVSGFFDAAGEVILQARSLNGRSGHNVVTPLVLTDGAAILVNRGWVPIDVGNPPVAGAEPPTTPVTVVGIVRPTEVRRGLGPVDPPSGVLDRISRVDIERLRPQFEYALEDFYLQLVSPPPVTGLPAVLPAPEAGGGPPHLSYAVQWFAFALVVAVGYPILLRTTARKASV